MTDSIVDRATSAYRRRCTRNGVIYQQPDRHDSGVERHQGKDYAVLRSIRGTLAVYLVTDGGLLRGLDSWPEALTDAGTLKQEARSALKIVEVYVGDRSAQNHDECLAALATIERYFKDQSDDDRYADGHQHS